MGELRLESFTYYNIAPLDLNVQSGECVSLSGPSGSGKSLFLRAVADLDDYGGTMYLNGEAADEIPAHEWRRRVGLLPAESAWWGDYVREHFTVLDDRWLTAVGFDESVMEWEVSRMSSGERQRLSLVRLLSNTPEVLLLDEPTANLDPDNVDRAEKLINNFRRKYNPILFWVSHDPRQSKRVAERHLVIERQTIREVSS